MTTEAAEPTEATEPTIDEKVAAFMDSGNGPEATAEYRASLEAEGVDKADQAERVTEGDAGRAAFARAATVLRSGSGTEQKFEAVAKAFDLMASNW